MARRKNPNPTEPVTIQLPKPMYDFLDELSQMGKFGSTVHGIATQLLIEKITEFYDRELAQKAIREMEKLRAYNKSRKS